MTDVTPLRPSHYSSQLITIKEVNISEITKLIKSIRHRKLTVMSWPLVPATRYVITTT